MPIIPYDNRQAKLDKRYLTIDSQGRIYLNRESQRLLGIEKLSAELYVGYDPVNKRIGLAKPDVVRMTELGTYRFAGDRPYASARNFCKDNGIYPKKGSDRYLYHGKEKDWFTFQLEEYASPDDAYKEQASSITADPVDNKEKLRSLLKEHPNYTHKQYAELLGVDRSYVSKMLKRLSKEERDA